MMSRTSRGLLRLLGALALVGLLSACDWPFATGSPPVAARVEIWQDSLVLTALGDTARLEVTTLDRRGKEVPDAVVEWSSLDPAVARVDTFGAVEALGNGIGRVVARVDAAADTVRVVVNQIPISMEVTPALLGFAVAGTAQLSIVGVDRNGHPLDGPRVSWSSTEPSVAAVDTTGLVRAGQEGRTRITATAGDLTAEALATVAPSGSLLSLQVGGFPWEYPRYSGMFAPDQAYVQNWPGGDIEFRARSMGFALENPTASIDGTQVDLAILGPSGGSNLPFGFEFRGVFAPSALPIGEYRLEISGLDSGGSTLSVSAGLTILPPVEVTFTTPGDSAMTVDTVTVEGIARFGGGISRLQWQVHHPQLQLASGIPLATEEVMYSGETEAAFSFLVSLDFSKYSVLNVCVFVHDLSGRPRRHGCSPVFQKAP